MFKKKRGRINYSGISGIRPKKSHKKRNALIGLGTVAAIVIGAGATAKKDEQR